MNTAVSTPPEIVTVIFRWSTRHGECLDCGNPAAFLSYRYDLATPARVCAVCAANDAADGGIRIERIDDRV